MSQNELGTHNAHTLRASFIMPLNVTPILTSEEDLVADVDEPPDSQCTPRPSALKLHDSFKGSFAKHTPRMERQQSLLSTALHSNNTSPVEEHSYDAPRGMSCVSTWSNNSASTAELTSDGGLTSPGTRNSTPSPPLPPMSSLHMLPISNKPLDARVAIVRPDGQASQVSKTTTVTTVAEPTVEAGLGRKRCITFACGGKKESKSDSESTKTASEQQTQINTEPPKRACTIKFACPAKISTTPAKPRARAASPAPPPRPPRTNPRSTPKLHRGSDSTVRNASPISVRKVRTSDRTRRLSSNSDLARTEAFRFHEFASSEEEVEEWTQESTCHRRPLTIKDTLIIENNLRQLGEEAEEEALDDEDEDMLDEEDDEDDQDHEDDFDEEDEEDSDAADSESDEGFQTDNEEGFAVSDDDSDAGSDYNWWTPGRSTAATSIEHLDHIRPSAQRSMSGSSVASDESDHHYKPEKIPKRRRSRPVNIRVPSPELPDSTDFVCGTLDEDRPLEEAYITALEQRRLAKHKKTPQDVDPTFPTSDPEMDEEDEDDEPDNLASESDQHLMVHGQMEALNGDLRGRHRAVPKKRSPVQSPKRYRSPPPTKRAVHRSPPPRKLFGQSPKRLRSPAPIRLRSPPPTRRGSSFMIEPKRADMSIQFTGLAQRPVPTMTSSLPRTPVVQNPPELHFYDDEDTPNEFPVRRAIDIKVGLEKKRQRRKEQLYKKMQKKGTKEKRFVPGKGCERMREVGLGLAAHKGKVAAGFAFNAQPEPDQKDMHVLSV